MSKLSSKAIQSIQKKGLLLVYPIDNRPLPESLWSELHPKVKMRWEWDEDGDSRVAALWQLREELSRSSEVVYSKWYQNRATFFSRDLFAALYRISREWKPLNWRPESDDIIEVLEQDSPLSTKQIKAAVGLQGKMLESTYEKSMKALWQHFDIVGFGEIQDSSFPSLAVGATKVLFEDLIEQAMKMKLTAAQDQLEKYLPAKSLWRKHWDKISKQTR